MIRSIPVTHYLEYVAEAKAIRQRLAKAPTSTAVHRQALGDLADLAVRVLAETNDVFEGLAAFVMALQPEVRRQPRAPVRRP